MFLKAVRIPFLLTLFLVLYLMPLLAGAAAATGGVNGTVKDAAGAVLQGAQVTLQPSATTVATDAQGNFTIQDVKVGSYTLTVSYVGFASSTSDVVVTAGRP